MQPGPAAGHRKLIRSMMMVAMSVIPLWLVGRAAVRGEPELTSIFPLGGQPGVEFHVAVRGRSLDRVSSVWFDCEHLSATVRGVEDDKSASSGGAKKKKKSPSSASGGPPQVLLLTVKASDGAQPGVHYMRVMTPHGLSNPLPFRVHTEAATAEDPKAHDSPADAQKISEFPAVINAKLTGSGELDYYAFEVKSGDTLRFDALTAGGLDPALTLLEPTGSWFRPDRTTELAFNDEEISYPGLPLNASITYRFARAGSYLIRVNGFLGETSGDPAYQLSIRRGALNHQDADPMATAHMPAPSADESWKERTWNRELKADRLKTLWARSADPGSEVSDLPVVKLHSREPVPVMIPSLLEGAIEHPAEIHRVRFRVKAGDRIALEVETPGKTIPRFNPYLRIVSTAGDEAFTNVHSTVNTCGDTIIKQVQPKTIYSFPRAGEFILEIRDITHVYGDPAFSYRVALRQQIPHVGEVRLAEEQINLMAGEVTKVSVDTDQEEGFDGQIALTIEGLPAGVRVVTGTELQPQVPPPYNPGKVERFKTESQKATLLFMIERDAPPTSKPVEARIMAQPVVKARLGRPILVKKILITVVQPDLSSKAAVTDSGGTLR